MYAEKPQALRPTPKPSRSAPPSRRAISICWSQGIGFKAACLTAKHRNRGVYPEYVHPRRVRVRQNTNGTSTAIEKVAAMTTNREDEAA